MNVQQAISDIVAYNTLPPQIDYTRPWAIKAEDAEKHIRTLCPKSQAAANRKIRKQTDAYYEEDENGGSPAYYDSLF